MKVIDVEKKELDPKDFVRREAIDEDVSKIVKESCIIKHKGEIKCVYLVLPDDKVPKDLLKAVSSIKYGKSNRSQGLVTRSRIFGYMPRETMRKDYCSSTAMVRDYPIQHQIICNFATTLAEQYKKYCPEMYEMHDQMVQQKVKPDWVIKDSPFTSGIINKNNPLNYHFDNGNFSNVYSNMLAFKKDCVGGHLTMPEYDIGLEIANNSVTFFDGQKILHGVTPFTLTDPFGYRFTIVYYSLKRMWQCLDPADEINRIKQVKSDREYRRYQRLKGEIPNEI
jgi:hypothetical protein